MMRDKLIAEYVARDVCEGMKSMKKELKEEIKSELRGGTVGQHELQFLRDMYKGITLGRVVDAWRSSKAGKEWSGEVSSKMGSDPQDTGLVHRVSVLFQRLDKAKLDGDEQTQEIVEDELKLIEDIINNNGAEDKDINSNEAGDKDIINNNNNEAGGVGLSGDGFLKVIRAYLSTYGFVHKELRDDELLHVCKIAKEGAFGLGEGDEWISAFATDVLADYK